MTSGGGTGDAFLVAASSIHSMIRINSSIASYNIRYTNHQRIQTCWWFRISRPSRRLLMSEMVVKMSVGSRNLRVVPSIKAKKDRKAFSISKLLTTWILTYLIVKTYMKPHPLLEHTHRGSHWTAHSDTWVVWTAAEQQRWTSKTGQHCGYQTEISTISIFTGVDTYGFVGFLQHIS